MSEQEICEHGKPKDECPICEIEGAVGRTRDKKGVEVIRVEHVGIASKGTEDREDLKAKLEQREEELEVIALKQLEREKKKLLDTIEDPNKKAYVDRFIGEDPSKLEQVKATMIMLGKALEIGGYSVEDNPEDTESPPPSGVAKGIPPEGRLLGSGISQINAVYDILENPKSTDAEKAEARKKADELLSQFIAGRREAIREDPKHRYYVGYSMCPKCLKPIFLRKGDKEARVCPECGAVLTKRQG